MVIARPYLAALNTFFVTDWSDIVLLVRLLYNNRNINNSDATSATFTTRRYHSFYIVYVRNARARCFVNVTDFFSRSQFRSSMRLIYLFILSAAYDVQHASLLTQLKLVNNKHNSI